MLLIILLLAFSHPTTESTTIDSLIAVYDQELQQAQTYFDQRDQAIEIQKSILHQHPDDHAAAYALAKLYAPYKCDSSLAYAQLACDLAGNNPPQQYLQVLQNEQDMLRGELSHYIDRYVGIEIEGTHSYAMQAYVYAIEAKEKGDSLLYLEWLLRSAISDVRAGIADNGSSWEIASLLFNQGDIDRAYSYVEYSFNNAISFNARLRFTQIVPLENSIHSAWIHQQQKGIRTLIIMLVIVFILSVILAAIVFYTLHQYSRLRRLNRQQKELNDQLRKLNTDLRETNLVKEQFICRYLEVYSEYIHRLTKMARKAGEKNPDAFMAKEMDRFYTSFDNTFLSLYRNFIHDFNALLRPEEQILPKQGELLTTELRIFALIRLGIDSSSRIAELLCYSPNTIYNYRARVRNAALGERDTFEDRVRTIGS